MGKLLGMEMQQEPQIVLFMNRLLEEASPHRIIELGTGWGGLTVFLGLWAYMNKRKMVSFDLTPRHEDKEPILATLGVRCIQGNVFSAWETIGDAVSFAGTTMLLCDNGNKKREFNLFAPFLKVGDVIMCHDYSRDGSVRHELTYADLEASCRKYRLQPVMEEEFKPYNWGVFRKAGNM